MTSFVFWEICHSLRLFPKDRYVKFDNGNAVAITAADIEVESDLNKILHNKGLIIKRSLLPWRYIFITSDGVIYGSLQNDLHSLFISKDDGFSAAIIWRFGKEIKSVFVTTGNIVLVSIEGSVFRSVDNGRTFATTLDLSCPRSYVTFNVGVAETPTNIIIIGEYGNIHRENGWQSVAYLYLSSDGGATWSRVDFLKTHGVNKHVHIVRYSKLLNRLILTDGDNMKNLWIGNVPSIEKPDIGWQRINKYHMSIGGYTSIAESDSKILMGSDYNGGTNFLVETDNGVDYSRSILPDPYRRNPIIDMVRRQSINRVEIWVSLHSSMTPNVKCLLMFTRNDGKTWNKVIEYNGITHNTNLISTSNIDVDVLWFSITNKLNNSCAVYQLKDL